MNNATSNILIDLDEITGSAVTVDQSFESGRKQSGKINLRSLGLAGALTTALVLSSPVAHYPLEWRTQNCAEVVTSRVERRKRLSMEEATRIALSLVDEASAERKKLAELEAKLDTESFEA